MKVILKDWPKNPAKKRSAIIKIDSWDSYSAYHTISLIMVPLLEDLKKRKVGWPSEFTPKGYFSKSSKEQKASDKKSEKEWDAVLDKMIWSFKECRDDNPGEEAAWKKVKNSKKVKADINTVTKYADKNKIDLSKDFGVTETFDKKVYEAYYKKVDEGLLLFAKYFRNLWW